MNKIKKWELKRKFESITSDGEVVNCSRMSWYEMRVIYQKIVNINAYGKDSMV